MKYACLLRPVFAAAMVFFAATPAMADDTPAPVRAAIVDQYAQMQRAQAADDLPGFFAHLAPRANIDLGFLTVSKEQLENYWEHPANPTHPVKFSAYQVAYQVLDIAHIGNSYVAHVTTHSTSMPALAQDATPDQTLAAGFANAEAYTTWQRIQGQWLITNIQIDPSAASQ